MSEITVNIDGMSCNHCTMRVKKAIDGISGVNSSNVEVGKAVVHVDDTKVKREDIENIINKAGYKVK